MATADLSQAPGSSRLSLQRAIWRWHFYAGLLSVPFLILLAITGSLYLFKGEINHTVFAYRTVVTETGTPALPPSALVAKAVAALPGSTATSFGEPASPAASAVVTVTTGDGPHLVYLNPYTGAVLATMRSDREPMYLLKKIHSLELFGTLANRLIEAIAGFALVLVVTGFYLWWPRGRSGGVLTVRATPGRRIWWRDVHAVTGALAGLVIFFLALTGMPWSGFWGANLSTYSAKLGIGFPAQLWDDVPKSALPTQAVLPNAGWAVENAPVPLSAPAAGAAPIGIDRAMAVAHGLGLAPGFEMALPSDGTGVYTAAIYFGDLSKERTVHIDQYSGKPIVDLGFKDYGPVGKAIEFGINVHQGMEWGLANQLVMLATCLSIVLASVSAVVMWWKRRPAGKMGVPPYPADPGVFRFLWAAAVAVGIVFPITGLAVLAMLAFDLLAIRTIPPLRRAFA
ncbi:putative iron-regulated membrane protein [Labrys monachus]|uniref:Iron-regulated membrane protein n=2 Tax=Labrys monachus TaxID=217067 RepID=A0ABU0FEF9_9HYPH|nr:PepSY domain-containing protein [Labrys monachus]MDQ0392702.1 putative iron-regulated membrane protein [Labrys monachus]